MVPGTKQGNEQQTTEVHYGADGAAAAQQVLDAFGVGEFVPDDAVKSGHVLVVVGTDLEVPSGLRAPGAAFAVPAGPGAAPAARPASFSAALQAPVAHVQTALAASVPCVN